MKHGLKLRALALAFPILGGCANQGPLNLPATSAGANAGTNNPDAATAPALHSSVAGGSIQVGGKSKQMSSTEVDGKCTRLVVPFELSSNAIDLAQLGTSIAAEQLGAKINASIEQLISGSPPAAGNKGPVLQVPHAELRLAAKRMNWLPMDVELQYGRYLLEQKDKAGGLLSRSGKKNTQLYQSANKMLEEVLSGVQEPHAYHFELFISTDSGNNAAALPGGILLIDRALVENPALRDKAYFALAHEIAHVLQRHETRAIQAKAFDAMALKSSQPEMVKTMQSAGKEPAAILSLLVQGKLLFERHSEAQELQSDACAVRLLDESFKKDDAKLRAALQGFINGLPKPEAEAGAAGKQVASAGKTSGTALQGGAASGLKTSATTKTSATNAMETLGNAVDLVTRPIDTHPSTEARVALLNEMLAEVRKRSPAPTSKPGKPNTGPTPKPAAEIKKS